MNVKTDKYDESTGEPIVVDIDVEEFFDELEALYEKYNIYICPPCEHDGLIVRKLETEDIEYLRSIDFTMEAAKQFKVKK